MKYLPTVCFINPNSTVSMTDTCRHTLDRIDLGSYPIFEFVTNDQGPAAIQVRGMVSLRQRLCSSWQKNCLTTMVLL